MNDRAEQRVGPRGEDLDVAGRATRKRTARAFAAADPVALHGLDGVGPLEQVEVVEQSIGVRGDAHHPLAQVALEHGIVAALAAAVGRHLFVGQHGAECGTPVDRRVGRRTPADDR